MTLTERQTQILKIIVEEYTKTAQPVGSKTIIDNSDIHSSSATIRNECVVLEQQGYLEKEHASSGRIPSTKGYRFYVDNLMEAKNIDDVKTRIESLFALRTLSIQQILDHTGKILSEMTNLASFVIGPHLADEQLKKIEFLSLSDKQAVVIFVLDGGHVENKIFTIDDSLSMEDLQISIDLFNSRLHNTKLSEIYEKFNAIRPILEQQVKNYDLILKQFADALTNMVQPTYTTYGIQYMLQNPEYNNSERIKETIKFIENLSPFDFFKKFEHKEGQNVSIKIGNEVNKTDNLSLLTTTYKVDDAQEGGIVLVGPKRIDYDKVYEILEWLSDRIKQEYMK